MTDADTAAIDRIVAQADGLADQILASEVPDICVYRALHDLVARKESRDVRERDSSHSLWQTHRG